MNKINFHEQATDFLEKLFLTFSESQIEIAQHWDIDHLCYRVDSLERFVELKKSFLSFGKLLIESEINGRSIASFKLNSPIFYKDWMIDVVELPAPKLSKIVKEGFEHLEVVCDVSFTDLEKKYQHLNLDLGGLKKEFNQELEINLGERNVKFHHMSLESVIRLENNKNVFNAIHDSNILRSFKIYTPLIIGDFPLGIHTKDSSVDILMSAFDLDELENSLKLHYENHEEFDSLRSYVDGFETLVVNFKQDELLFEIFAQKKVITEQISYRKFQIKERLVKLGGDIFKETIMGIRMDGTKSGTAFAEALSIHSDLDNGLMLLQKSSMIKLKSILESVSQI